MPTYDYRCAVCGDTREVFQSIGDYCREPLIPICIHGGEQCVMDRVLSVNPLMSGVQNALAGDRNYDGLKATDGTPIDTRTKHREYMRSRGLAMDTDFTETWKKAAHERHLRRTGQWEDKELKKEITEQVMRAVAQPGD